MLKYLFFHFTLNLWQGIPGVPKIGNNYNPATWVLEVTSISSEAELGVNFAEIYRHSALYVWVRQTRIYTHVSTSCSQLSKLIHIYIFIIQHFFTYGIVLDHTMGTRSSVVPIFFIIIVLGQLGKIFSIIVAMITMTLYFVGEKGNSNAITGLSPFSLPSTCAMQLYQAKTDPQRI